MLNNRTPATKPEKKPSQSTMYSNPIPIACVVASPSHMNAEEYSATPASDERTTASVALVSAMNATWLVRNELAAMNGVASVMIASSLGTTICQRGIGESVRLAMVRSSISLAKAAAAIASTIIGVMDPLSIALNTTCSNSTTVGP